MLKAYKYRLYPDKEQEILIAKTFGCCRFVYNQLLSYKQMIYQTQKRSLSKIDCNNYCNRTLKSQYEWLREVDKFALTNAIYNMEFRIIQKFLRNFKNFSKNMQDFLNIRANMTIINPIQRIFQTVISLWILIKVKSSCLSSSG